LWRLSSTSETSRKGVPNGGMDEKKLNYQDS